MDNEAIDNISRFKTYYDYLDSLIAEEDINYLQDGELARLIGSINRHIDSRMGTWVRNSQFLFYETYISFSFLNVFFCLAELGYRGAGKTLTEKEYLEEVERVEMAKKLKEINENAEQAGDLLGDNPGDSLMVRAIKQRYKTSLKYNQV